VVRYVTLTMAAWLVRAAEPMPQPVRRRVNDWLGMDQQARGTPSDGGLSRPGDRFDEDGDDTPLST
jgi:hypothetical protein